MASNAAVAGVTVALNRRPSESAGRRALRRFVHHRGALVGLAGWAHELRGARALG